jgi:epoxyqueuosine reductase
MAPRAQRVHRLAKAEGFGLCGIAPAAASPRGDWVRQWLAAGKHGQMDYLASRIEQRLDPATLMPGAKAVIVVADAYDRGGPKDEEGGQVAEPSTGKAVAGDQNAPSPNHQTAKPPNRFNGRITKYARGKDYHKTVKKRLHRIADDLRAAFPEAQFKCTCDTAPTLEREHAERAGLGWVGKHTLMIHPRHGSYFFLGCIITDLALQTSADANYPGDLTPPTDHCGTCTRCIEACPTQCIDNPADTGRRSIDASRCISYLTIEHRDAIAPSLHEAMGDWLAGCDVCQDVCPFNNTPSSGGATGPLPLPGDDHGPVGSPSHDEASERRTPTGLPIHDRYTPNWPDRWRLLDVLHWNEADYQMALSGSALKRIKLAMWKRNALIVAGNQLSAAPDHAPPPDDAAALRRRIEQLAQANDEPTMVTQTARQVLARLDASR